MLYWLLPDPFNPAVNFGDVIACLAMCAGLLVLFVNVPRNAEELVEWCNSVDVDGDACDTPRDLADRIRKLAATDGERS